MFVGYYDIDKNQLFMVKDEKTPMVGVPIKNNTKTFLPQVFLVEYVEACTFEEFDLQEDLAEHKEKAFLCAFFRGLDEVEVKEYEDETFNELLWEMLYEDVAEVMERMEEEEEDY